MRVFPWALGLLLASETVGAAAPTSSGVVDVSFAIRVCEGAKSESLLNDKIGSRERDCAKPLAGVSVALSSAYVKTPFVETDAAGRAVVGPLTIRRGEEFRVALDCKTHRCTDLEGLNVNKGTARVGENVLLVFTSRNAPATKTGK